MRHALTLAVCALSTAALAEEPTKPLRLESPGGALIELPLDGDGVGHAAWVEDGELWQVSAEPADDGDSITLRWRHRPVRPIRHARETTVTLPRHPFPSWKVERVTVDATRHQFTVYMPDEAP